MDDLEEKRVFSAVGGHTRLLVAADAGLVDVDVAEDRVGGFRLVHACTPTDVAAGGGVVIAATDEDVLRGDGDTFEPTGFGPATAVAAGDGSITAAAPDGRVATLAPGAGEWTTRGWLDAAINAIDGDLIATDGGVHRLADGLPHVGLSAVRDVAAAGIPLAATADGLYALGNGWMRTVDGPFEVAATDGSRAHAASAGALYQRVDGGWEEVDADLPGVVDVEYAGHPYAVTADGTLSSPSTDGTGWRSHALGLTGVVGLASRRA